MYDINMHIHPTTTQILRECLRIKIIYSIEVLSFTLIRSSNENIIHPLLEPRGICRDNQMIIISQHHGICFH